jgi:hypothetical protein
MHEHPQGVVVNLTDAHLRFARARSHKIFSKRGEARWFPPFRHKVENLGDAPYDGVYIGVKGKALAAAALKTAPMNTDEQIENLLLSVALEPPLHKAAAPAGGKPPADR